MDVLKFIELGGKIKVVYDVGGWGENLNDMNITFSQDNPLTSDSHDAAINLHHSLDSYIKQVNPELDHFTTYLDKIVFINANDDVMCTVNPDYIEAVLVNLDPQVDASMAEVDKTVDEVSAKYEAIEKKLLAMKPKMLGNFMADMLKSFMYDHVESVMEAYDSYVGPKGNDWSTNAAYINTLRDDMTKESINNALINALRSYYDVQDDLIGVYPDDTNEKGVTVINDIINDYYMDWGGYLTSAPDYKWRKNHQWLLHYYQDVIHPQIMGY